jgi:hypothetical protein
VKEPFVFGYWKLVICFQNSFKQRMIEIDFSDQFFTFSKGLNWMAPKFRETGSRFAVSFLKELRQTTALSTIKVVCNACGIIEFI